MNIHMLAADIAARVPAMAQDCAENNTALIEHLILEEMNRKPNPKLQWVVNPEWEKATHRIVPPNYDEIKVGPPPEDCSPANSLAMLVAMGGIGGQS